MTTATWAAVHRAELPTATLEYRDTGGDGPVLVFVAGLLANAELWRDVVTGLDAYRCIAVDLPLGAHRVPAPDADLSFPGLAALVAAFLEHLDLTDVTLVGNDSGGGVCQGVVADHPERVARLVLTSCDVGTHYPPRPFGYLPKVARVPGALPITAATMRFGFVRRLPIAFGWLTREPLAPELVASFLGQAGRPEIRADVRRALRDLTAADLGVTMQRLRGFDRPVLLAWADTDKVFPVEHGRELAAAFDQVRFELVPDSYAFVPVDQPQRLIDLLTDFVPLAVTTTA